MLPFGWAGSRKLPRLSSLTYLKIRIAPRSLNLARTDSTQLILFESYTPKGTDGLPSRRELAEFAKAKKKIVAGIEDGFRRKKYITHVLEREYSNNAVVCNTLEETCRIAAKKANRAFKNKHTKTAR